MDRFFKVKVTMICEKSVEVEVAVGLDELTPDEDGSYSGDAINDRAEELARQCISRNYDFDHMELDASEIVAPDNVDYWV
jgi:hypothetical protein